MTAIARVLVAIACLSCAPPAHRPATGIPIAGNFGDNTRFSPGVIDTLRAIAGKPHGVVVMQLPPNWLGAYIKPVDVIIIAPEVARLFPAHRPDSAATWLTRMSPDWVLAHEFGHRLDRRRGHEPSRVWMRSAYKIAAQSEYANSDLEERWAEAFANAFDLLRYAATEPDRERVRRSMAQREAFIPGTGDVIAFLLRQPIYRAHPLNRCKDRGRR